MQHKFLALLCLICAPAFAQQTVNGNLIQTGTMPLNKIVPQSAGTIVCTPTGGSASPSACNASQAGAALGLAPVATSGSASDLGTGTLPAGRLPALTGDVSSSAGSASTTVNTVGGQSAANVASGAAAANAATNLNTPSTIVKRDSSGNFSAGTITGALNGNATTATTAGSAPPSGSASGDLSGTYPNPTVSRFNGSSPAGSSVLIRNFGDSVAAFNQDINMNIANPNPVNTSGTQDGILYSLTNSATGGTVGATQAALHGKLYTGTGATSYGWAVIGEAHNQTTTAIGNTVGGDFLGEMINSGGGPTWGLVSYGLDSSGVADTPQHLFGAEIDLGAIGTDANLNRYGMVIVGKGDGTTFHAAGIRIGGIRTTTGGGACYSSCATFIDGLQLAGNFTTGLDMTLGAYTGNAIQLSTATTMGLDGIGGTHTFGYANGTGVTFYQGGNPAVQIGDTTGTVDRAILISPGSSGGGTQPTIRAQTGNLRVQAAGTSTLLLGTASNGDSARVLDCGAACSNQLTLKGAGVGVSPTIGVLASSDTNANLNFATVGQGNVTVPSLKLASNISVSNSGANGAQLFTGPVTITDTTGTGTVAVFAVNTLAQDALAASNAVTYTRAATLYIPGAPTASTNVTSANGRSILAGGLAEFQGGATVSGGSVSLNANSNNPVNIGTGSTTSAVTLGGGSNVVNIASPLQINGKLLSSTAAPTISSGFGTSPSVVANNGTAVFTVNVGTGGSATSGVVGLPTASTGWACYVNDITTTSSTVFMTKVTATSTTSVTVGNFNTSGAAAAWAASDVLQFQCKAY